MRYHLNRFGCGSDNEKWQSGCHLLEFCVSQDGKDLLVWVFYLCNMNMCQLWLGMPAGVTQLTWNGRLCWTEDIL